MASAVTTAIDALTAVVKEGIDNSKIINTLDKEISRALGLLVDLILLPFLPILIYGIVTLYMAILAFGKWWNDVTSVLKKEGLLGLIKVSLVFAWDTVVGVIRAILEYLFSEKNKEPLGFKIITTITAVYEGLLGWILDLVFGAGAGKAFFGFLEASLDVIWAAVDWLITAILDWIFGTHNAEAKFLTLQLLSAKLVGLWWDVINWVFTEQGAKDMKIALDLIMKDPGGWLWGAIKWLMSGSVSVVGSILSGAANLFGYAEGGMVPGPKGQAQMAVVHGGETITPEGKGGNNTFNFYGYQDDKFIAKVRDVMRGDATRYSQ